MTTGSRFRTARSHTSCQHRPRLLFRHSGLRLSDEKISARTSPTPAGKSLDSAKIGWGTCFRGFLDYKRGMYISRRQARELPPLVSLREFPRHCPLHHCNTYPDEYWPPFPPRASGKPCPACLWVRSFWDFENELPFHQNWGHFRVTPDASLPNFPTPDQILRTINPLIRCAKEPESRYDGNVRDLSREESVDWEALRLCGLQLLRV